MHIETGALISSLEYISEFKKKVFFGTPEGKKLAEQNHLAEEDINNLQDEYYKLLEQKKKELTE
ncbi:hypothetical protein [Caldicellulosiruptor obsidiansis]|uniref:hypothetical protein n=1 Tax=Caldicellulosiruptor obsidiansis TaxID=717609 RepID=UPI0002FD6D51|nr:hypothetical protein [Caldicellulosiruptor obsidiansis]